MKLDKDEIKMVLVVAGWFTVILLGLLLIL